MYFKKCKNKTHRMKELHLGESTLSDFMMEIDSPFQWASSWWLSYESGWHSVDVLCVICIGCQPDSWSTLWIRLC